MNYGLAADCTPGPPPQAQDEFSGRIWIILLTTHYSLPIPSHQTTKTPPTPSNVSTSPRLIRTILLRYYNLTVSRIDATISHVPATPRRSSHCPATHYAGIALLSLVHCLSYSPLSFLPMLLPTFDSSLTEQKESKPRASNPFVLKRIEKAIPATPFDSYACKFRGGYFSPPLFLPQSSPIPHFGPTPISDTISRPWPLRAFQCPVGAAQEQVSR